MQQSREFHFYAAHRNKDVGDAKCAMLHGHCYDVTFVFERADGLDGRRTDAAELCCLFADVDVAVRKVHEFFDHACLVDRNDETLYDFLCKDRQKMYDINGPTSVENVALCLMHELDVALQPKGYSVLTVTLKETKKDRITVNRQDYKKEAPLLGL